MAISMYSASAPVFLSMLTGLSHVLARGEAHAAEAGVAPEEYLTARLAPDMYPLTRQVQIASDHAKGAVARLAGKPVPAFADVEKDFAELQARIGKTRDFVKGFSEADLAGSDERAVEIKLASRTLNLSGEQYLLQFAMPNFYFHVTAAYAILRMKGVPIGKSDFFGGR